MTKPLLSEDEIDRIQGDAYQALVAAGYSGGMGGSTWDRASARAIESAILAKLAEGVEGEVKRYDLSCSLDGGGPPNEEESAHGDYVRYEDYAATLAAVRAELADTQKQLGEAQLAIHTLERQVEHLEGELHSCGPTCSQAGCVNARLTAELADLKDKHQALSYERDGMLEELVAARTRIAELESAISAELDPAWQCNSYHPKLLAALSGQAGEVGK